MRLQILGKDIPSNTMKILMTFFAHIRIIVLSDVLNLMFLKGVLSIFLLPLPRKFTTYWRMSIKKATGYDNVPATIIKMAADEFASPLTNLSIDILFPQWFEEIRTISALQMQGLACVRKLPSSQYTSIRIKNFERYTISNYTNILSMFYRTYYLHFGRDMGVNT